MSARDFDWYGEDVVVREQAAVAVYQNPRGAIVIRQKADWCDEDDTWISIEPDRAAALAKAILALADELGAIGSTTLALPAPMTPAERQRRHRHAKCHASVTTAVTQRDSNTEDMFAAD